MLSNDLFLQVSGKFSIIMSYKNAPYVMPIKKNIWMKNISKIWRTLFHYNEPVKWKASMDIKG